MFCELRLVVEGETEESFIRDILKSHLGSNINLKSVLLHGVKPYAKIKKDILASIHTNRNIYVTTMLDFYKLPKDFPGWGKCAQLNNPLEKVKLLEQIFADDIKHPRFIPYIQMHEFEALLFSDIEIIDEQYDVTKLPDIKKIVNAFPSPEHINDSEATAPSKRLFKLYPYEKLPHGANICKQIGIQKIRSKCHHFDLWLKRLESLNVTKD